MVATIRVIDEGDIEADQSFRGFNRTSALVRSNLMTDSIQNSDRTGTLNRSESINGDSN